MVLESVRKLFESVRWKKIANVLRPWKGRRR